MTIDEVRLQKGLALLEVEEARQALESLGREARAVSSRLKALASFGDAITRRNESLVRQREALRAEVESAAPEFGAALDLGNLLALDDRIGVAERRLQDALELKRVFGL